MVLAITVVLAGLLFPVLSEVRQRADRAMSANNLRTIGLAVTMYDGDWSSMPASSLLDEGRSPSELTMVFRPEYHDVLGDYDTLIRGWDGLGRLWGWGYTDTPRIFFAPHVMDGFERDRREWEFRRPSGVELHGDYHYGGHVAWDTGGRRFLHDQNLVIASDTLRQVDQLNHEDGLNLVRSDGSVEWEAFTPEFLELLARPWESPEQVKDRYLPLWRALEGGSPPGSPPGEGEGGG